jgi:hypothetical protein
MPILTEVDQWKKRRPAWLVILLLIILVLLPGFLLFNTNGCQAGKFHLHAQLDYHPNLPRGFHFSPGYSASSSPVKQEAVGGRTYYAQAGSRIPHGYHFFVVGPWRLSLQWLDTSNTTRIAPPHK